MNIIVRTMKDTVASFTRWKICWIFDPHASWSSIRVASDLSARSFNSFISCPRILNGDMFLMISFGLGKTTYDLNFSIASSAAFGQPLTTVLSTTRSLFAVSSRHCASSSLLPPTAWYNQYVPRIQRQQRTSLISMIILAMENAILTGLVSTQSGSFLRSVTANREATPRPSFVNAFQSETCIWEFSPEIVEVSLDLESSSSSNRVRCQSFRR